MPAIGRSILEILTVTPEIIEARKPLIGCPPKQFTAGLGPILLLHGKLLSEREMGKTTNKTFCQLHHRSLSPRDRRRADRESVSVLLPEPKM
jgi:hypothetical protein